MILIEVGGTVKQVSGGESMQGPDDLSRTRRTPGPAWVQGAIAAVALGALVLYTAFRGGGLDLVVRQQAGLVLWVGITLALISGALPRSRPTPGVRTVGIAFATLAAWQALGVLWAPNPDDALARLNEFSLAIGAGLALLLAVHRRTWLWPAYGLLAVLSLVVVAAAGERLLPDAFGFELGGAGTRRLAGPLQYWNALASLAAACLVLCLALGVGARSSTARMVVLGTIPWAALALHLTYSRGGILAFAAGAAVLVALSPRRDWLLRRGGIALGIALVPVLALRTQSELAAGTGTEGAWVVLLALLAASVACALLGRARRRQPLAVFGVEGVAAGSRRGLAAAVVLALALALAAGALLADQPAGGVDERAAPAEPDQIERLASFESRRSGMWESALAAGAQNAFAGEGPGSYRTWWARQGGEPLVGNAHSLYLEIFAELGAVGLLALLVGLIALLRVALAARARLTRTTHLSMHAGLLAACAAILVQAAFDWVWSVPTVALVAAAAAALAVAAGTDPRPPSRRFGIGRGVAVVGCLLVAAAQVPALIAVDRSRGSAAALAVGDVAGAAELADSARAAAPFSPLAKIGQAEVALAAGREVEALEIAETAREAAPDDWRYAITFARVALAAGEMELAAEALREAAVLRPAARELYLGLASDTLRGRAAPGDL